MEKLNYPVDWDLKELKKISEVILSNVDKKSNAKELPVQLCNYTDVYKNDFITNSIPFMKATASKSEIEKFGLKLGDVIITKDSEEANDIGVPSVVLEELNNVLCGYHLAIIRPNSKIDSHFLSNVFSSSIIHRQLIRLANGVTRFGLSQGAIEGLHIPVPPTKDQEKIGSILRSYSIFLRELEDLISKKILLKKALMQQLLTGKKRFPEFNKIEWEETSLGEYFTEFSTTNSSDEKLPLLTCSKLYGILLQEERFGKRIASTNVKRYKIVNRNDLVYDPMLLWDASIAFVKNVEKGLISPAYATLHFDFQKGNRKFFEYLFQTHYLRHQYKVISRGTNVRRKKAPVSDFLAVKIKVPKDIAEQNKIADLFEKIEKEISLLQTKLELIKTQKKGLMQKLLTGQIRVKV